MFEKIEIGVKEEQTIPFGTRYLAKKTVADKAGNELIGCWGRNVGRFHDKLSIDPNLGKQELKEGET